MLFLVVAIVLTTRVYYIPAQTVQEEQKLSVLIDNLHESHSDYNNLLTQASVLKKLVAYEHFTAILSLIRSFENQNMKFKSRKIDTSEILYQIMFTLKEIRATIQPRRSLNDGMSVDVKILHQQRVKMGELLEKLQRIKGDFESQTTNFIHEIEANLDTTIELLSGDISQSLSQSPNELDTRDALGQKTRRLTEIKSKNKDSEEQIEELKKTINLLDIAILQLDEQIGKLKKDSIKHSAKVNPEPESCAERGQKHDISSIPDLKVENKPFHFIYLLDVSKKNNEDQGLSEAKSSFNALNKNRSAGNDIFSLITFGEEVKIVVEGESINNPLDITKIVSETSSGTRIMPALNQAGNLIDRFKSYKFTPIIILFTDGMMWDSKLIFKLFNIDLFSLKSSWIASKPWLKWIFSEEVNTFKQLPQDTTESVSSSLAAIHKAFESYGFMTLASYMVSSNQKSLREFIKAGNGGNSTFECSGEIYDYFNQARRTNLLPEIFWALSNQVQGSKHSRDLEKQYQTVINKETEEMYDALEKISKAGYDRDFYKEQNFYETSISLLAEDRNKTQDERKTLQLRLVDLERNMIFEEEIRALEKELNVEYEELERVKRKGREVGTLNSRNIDVKKGLEGLRDIKKIFLVRNNFLQECLSVTLKQLNKINDELKRSLDDSSGPYSREGLVSALESIDQLSLSKFYRKIIDN